MSVPTAAAAAAVTEVPAAGSGGNCDSGSDDVDAVLDAVRRLYEEPRFQDVHFLCLDGRTVSSNRAFLAARCRYFEALLFGSLMEAHASEIRLQASSEAVRHVLMFLHTGGYGSIEAEGCWITLMEASSLAQQYMLPGMVKHVADRLSADLRPENLGVALSYALKVRGRGLWCGAVACRLSTGLGPGADRAHCHPPVLPLLLCVPPPPPRRVLQADLQAVIKSIWTALPRLLTRPFALDRSFSADAICFCLNHTAWMMAPAAAGGASSTAACGAHTVSSGGHAVAAAAAAAAPAEANGTAMHRATSINGASTGSSSMAHAEGAVVSSRGAAGCKADSSVAQEAQALKAVIAWMLSEVADCAECRCSRHEVRSSSTSHGGVVASAHAAVLVGAGQQEQQQPHGLQDGSSSSAGAGAAALQLVGRSSRPPSGVAAPAGGSSRTAGAAGIDRTSSTASLVGESSVPHPAMLPSSRSSSRQQQQAADATRAGTLAAAMRRLSSRGSAALSASLDSEASEGGLLGQEASQTLALDTAGVFAVLTVTLPAAAAAAEEPRGSSSSNGDGGALPTRGAAGAADASATAATDGSNSNSTEVSSAALLPAADGEQQGETDEPRFVGCCCEAHEAMLLRMLAHLSWHLLEPSVLERLDSLALLGPAAMLELYRWGQGRGVTRCDGDEAWHSVAHGNSSDGGATEGGWGGNREHRDFISSLRTRLVSRLLLPSPDRAHQRCSHMALWGNFPSLSLGGERGMRCFNSGGEQVRFGVGGVQRDGILTCPRRLARGVLAPHSGLMRGQQQQPCLLHRRPDP
jgi:hypothetical protein